MSMTAGQSPEFETRDAAANFPEHYVRNRVASRKSGILYRQTKRAFDIVASIMALPIVLFFILILLILNPIFNPGPLLFTQRRVGRYGKPFVIYKFRSMVGAGDTPLFASQEMDRVTGFGALIRHMRIDELPQFLNVFKGDMSLIGPRPEQEAFVKKFSSEIPNYAMRHEVPPGITGLAQVYDGYADDVQSTRSKLNYDLEYIREQGLSLDLRILFRTVYVVVTGFGAR